MACEDCRDAFEEMGKRVEKVHAEWTCKECGRVVFNKEEYTPIADEEDDETDDEAPAPSPSSTWFFERCPEALLVPLVALVIIGITAYQITALLVK